MSRLLSIVTPKRIKTLACTVIVGLTLIPALGHLGRTVLTPSQTLSNPQIAAAENRYHTPFPREAKSFTDFTAKVDNYVNDHFALRSTAIKSHQKLQRNLGGSKLPVYAGRDGWFFLGEDTVWNSYQGRGSFTRQTVQDFEVMVSALQTRSDQMSAAFAATISPNKASIYFDKTPIRFGQKSERNFHDTVMSTLDTPSLNLVNIKPVLMAEKNNQQLYYKTDTHWTHYGAFLGYRALMQHLKQTRPEINIVNQQQLKETIKLDFKGDLTKIGNLNNVQEKTQQLNPNPMRKFKVKQIENPDHRQGWRTKVHSLKANQDKTSLKLVIIGDSFSNHYLNFLKGSFDEIIFIHHKLGAFDLDDVFAHEPDAVIFNVVERFADITAETFAESVK